MGRDVRLSRGNSPYVGRITRGCRECIKGAKLVLFITGRCSRTCYYCPISAERRGKDSVYANELLVTDLKQALKEAQLIEATGMGITGGEPLLDLTRTCEYIRAFKRKFGSKFHIHLYTGLEEIPLITIEKLVDAGLDELRLHRFQIGDDLLALRKITKGKLKLGIEIPVIPNTSDQLKNFLRELDQNDIDFVNLNEFEFTSLNAKNLLKRGYTLDPDSIAAVKGSEETALEVLEWAAVNTSLNIHYCPLALKDGTQLRNRFRRRAKNVAKPYERISREGLLVKGIITPPSTMSLSEARAILTSNFGIPSDQIGQNNEKRYFETSTKILYRIAKRLKTKGFEVGIAEEFPIKSQFRVSFTPL